MTAISFSGSCINYQSLTHIILVLLSFSNIFVVKNSGKVTQTPDQAILLKAAPFPPDTDQLHGPV